MTENETESPKIIMYTTDWCPDCHRAKYLLDEYGVPYVNVDVEREPEGLAFVMKVNNGRRVVPTIVFPDGVILVEPNSRQLAEKAGIIL